MGAYGEFPPNASKILPTHAAAPRSATLAAMNLVLIGYRGCGKTTVGQLLADAHSLRLVDTDERVRRWFGGMTIKMIWQTMGPSRFRQIEANVLEQLLAGDRQVLATGGGAVIAPEGRRIVAEARNATRIYLHCEPRELHRRITADDARHDRPSTGTARNSLGNIVLELGKRLPIYREVADVEVDVTERSPEDVVAQITQRVRLT